MKVYDIAHARTGDKGNLSTISVIAYRQADYPRLEHDLTEERVLAQFAPLGASGVARYCMPEIGALNFVIKDTLGGGVTRTLALDAHGKALSALILDMSIDKAEVV